MNNRNMNGTAMPDLSTVYPEIYYRLQPYIIMVCDQLDRYYGDKEPNQETIDQITENIYQDIIDIYPDLLEYARAYENNNNTGTMKVSEVITRSPRIYRRGFRRRGLLRDLVDILFFSEFNRRRRKY